MVQDTIFGVSDSYPITVTGTYTLSDGGGNVLETGSTSVILVPEPAGALIIVIGFCSLVARLAHHWPFTGIAVPAASEDHNQLVFYVRTECCKGVFERVGRVGVIDKYTSAVVRSHGLGARARHSPDCRT